MQPLGGPLSEQLLWEQEEQEGFLAVGVHMEEPWSSRSGRGTAHTHTHTDTHTHPHPQEQMYTYKRNMHTHTDFN